MTPGRYHVTLSLGGRPVQHGWWGSKAVAQSKHQRWVRDWGRPGARVTLVDEAMGRVLTTWSDEG